MSLAVVAVGRQEFGPTARARLHAIARFAPAVIVKDGGDTPGAPPSGADEAGAAARLRQFGDASPDVFWIGDAATLATEYVSPAFATIYGASVADALADVDASRWADMVVEEDRADALASLARARAGEVSVVEYRIRRVDDGGLRWLRATDFPLRSATGAIERIGRIAHDITAAKLAAEESRVLQLELQHRVRNALAVIRALVRRSAEQSETVDDLASHLDGRINAFARVQAALARNPKAGLDLEHLLADELLAFSAHESGRVVLRGPRILLTPKAAETLGLILHELATNAVEHGVLGHARGQVRVVWSVRPDRDAPRLVIDWTEKGRAGAPDGPARRGFGTELLEKTLPYELNGTAVVRYEKQGIRCILEVPLTPLVLSGPA